MMKKVIYLGVMFVVVVSLSACSGNVQFQIYDKESEIDISDKVDVEVAGINISDKVDIEAVGADTSEKADIEDTRNDTFDKVDIEIAGTDISDKQNIEVVEIEKYEEYIENTSHYSVVIGISVFELKNMKNEKLQKEVNDAFKKEANELIEHWEEIREDHITTGYYIDFGYSIVRNDEKMFTLRVHRSEENSREATYYNIDKKNGELEVKGREELPELKFDEELRAISLSTGSANWDKYELATESSMGGPGKWYKPYTDFEVRGGKVYLEDIGYSHKPADGKVYIRLNGYPDVGCNSIIIKEEVKNPIEIEKVGELPELKFDEELKALSIEGNNWDKYELKASRWLNWYDACTENIPVRSDGKIYVEDTILDHPLIQCIQIRVKK